MRAPTVKLSSGYEMPMVGLGTWQSKPGEVGKAVEAALNAGYTHIDCAWVYGNQPEIGDTLQRLFSTTHKRGCLYHVEGVEHVSFCEGLRGSRDRHSESTEAGIH